MKKIKTKFNHEPKSKVKKVRLDFELFNTADPYKICTDGGGKIVKQFGNYYIE